jgi:hypothetical protein
VITPSTTAYSAMVWPASSCTFCRNSVMVLSSWGHGSNTRPLAIDRKAHLTAPQKSDPAYTVTTTTSQRSRMGGHLPGQTIRFADSSLNAYAPGPYFSTVTDVSVIRIFAHAALLV